MLLLLQCTLEIDFIIADILHYIQFGKCLASTLFWHFGTPETKTFENAADPALD